MSRKNIIKSKSTINSKSSDSQFSEGRIDLPKFKNIKIPQKTISKTSINTGSKATKLVVTDIDTELLNNEKTCKKFIFPENLPQ